jgi:hypothetical protein
VRWFDSGWGHARKAVPKRLCALAGARPDTQFELPSALDLAGGQPFGLMILVMLGYG